MTAEGNSGVEHGSCISVVNEHLGFIGIRGWVLGLGAQGLVLRV